MSEYPRLSTLTHFAFEVNAAIDEGHDHRFSFQEIYQGLDRRSLIEDLSEKLGDVVDLKLILEQKERHRGLIDVLQEASEAFRGREKSKTGVKRSGLRLLMAIILEAIQQLHWTTLFLKPFSPKKFGFTTSIPASKRPRSLAFCKPYGGNVYDSQN